VNEHGSAYQVAPLARLLLEVRLLDNQWKKVVALLGATLPLGSWEVLKALASGGPRTVPQLARLQLTSRQNVQVLVNRLKRTGQIEMRSNPAHKRSVLVILTERGRADLVKATESEARLLGDLSSSLGAVELDSAIRLLEAVRNRLAGIGGGPVLSQTTREPIEEERKGRRRNRTRDAAGQVFDPAQTGESDKAPQASESEPEELPVSLL
jgi:DNA-binding MarR family transcriptional regulator